MSDQWRRFFDICGWEYEPVGDTDRVTTDIGEVVLYSEPRGTLLGEHFIEGFPKPCRVVFHWRDGSPRHRAYVRHPKGQCRHLRTIWALAGGAE